MNQPHTDRANTVLTISLAQEDHNILDGIFGESAEVLHTDSLASALAVLQNQDVPIVICERELGLHNWKHVLDTLTDLDRPPLLIVTSRLADDHLWSEALNLGAYDVLAQPFDEQEVVRTVAAARRRWLN